MDQVLRNALKGAVDDWLKIRTPMRDSWIINLCNAMARRGITVAWLDEPPKDPLKKKMPPAAPQVSEHADHTPNFKGKRERGSPAVEAAIAKAKAEIAHTDRRPKSRRGRAK